MPPETAVANELLNQGVLGIFCVILMVAIVVLWRYHVKRTREYEQQLQDLHKQNADEKKQTLQEMIESEKRVHQTLEIARDLISASSCPMNADSSVDLPVQPPPRRKKKSDD
jgi:type II secretory pathway component PulM